MKPGRKTILDKELIAKIKECILEGKTLKETAKLSDLELNTLYRWTCDNYANLSDKVEGWRRDYKLIKADKNIDAILDLDPSDKDFTKPVADMSKFVKETLDKTFYSKRNELSGPNGKELPTPIINLNAIHSDDSNNKDS